ncbi:MAG: carboxypeptidase-like regulatory domain-containing protein [Cyclobacteriaceae bacterium]
MKPYQYIIFKSLLLAIALTLSASTFGQNTLTQTVRGIVRDIDSHSELIGATIMVVGSDPIIGTITDIDGTFRLENVPTGRITLAMSYIGYDPVSIPNIVVNSGKEVVLQLSMQESAVKMDELIITANQNPGDAINEMSIISTKSISPEETNRYAGGWNDPSKIMSNFAGVTATQDGGNDIIVRGNSPKYVQWRLEGIEITNPNHFADPSAVSGSVSTLNNNLLAASDFSTSAFTPEYGNALSAVYDVKLRAGNNEKFESVLGVGLLGTDLTLEGPFKKGYDGSFLVNYRYSTATFLSQIGLLDVGAIPKFQDAAFKLMLPTEKFGIFSVFGLSGLSSFEWEDVTPAMWETPGDRFMLEEIREDFDKKSFLVNTGINHTYSISKDSYINTTLAYSSEGIDDHIYEARIIEILDNQGAVVGDSVMNRTLNYRNRLMKSAYRAAVTYHRKINAQHKLQFGSKYSLWDYDIDQSRHNHDAGARESLVNFKESFGTLQNFVSWKYRMNDDIMFVGGLHNFNVLYNNKSTLEPRLAFNWKLSPNGAFHAGYGLHSTMESVHNYFTSIRQPDGSYNQVNEDLDVLKAHHYIVGYSRRIGKNLSAKIEAYYQDLYDIPVENDPTSIFSTLNEGLDFQYVDLVNEGSGRNYGLELTLERYFRNNYYYLLNGSLYESKYTALDGIERNSHYNNNYLINALFGKEFPSLGKKHNQTLAINGKIFFSGTRKIIPLMRDEQGNLAVDPDNGIFFDYSKAYENGLDPFHMITIAASYKWNKSKTTHELFLNIENITNTKGRFVEFYDPSEPNAIGYGRQFGLFPNLMYRVYF